MHKQMVLKIRPQDFLVSTILGESLGFRWQHVMLIRSQPLVYGASGIERNASVVNELSDKTGIGLQ